MTELGPGTAFWVSGAILAGAAVLQYRLVRAVAVDWIRPALVAAFVLVQSMLVVYWALAAIQVLGYGVGLILNSFLTAAVMTAVIAWYARAVRRAPRVE